MTALFSKPKVPQLPPIEQPKPAAAVDPAVAQKAEEERQANLNRARTGGRVGTILTSAQGVAGQPETKKTLLG